jgi:phage FluMu gp28-like protein
MDGARYRLGDKSRRIGLSYAESYATCRKRNLGSKVDYWYSSADESAAYEFIQYCKMWCEAMERLVQYHVDTYDDIIDGKVCKKNSYVVTFPSGARVTAMTSNPKRFRSKGGDVCLDEFDWHDNPEEMYGAAESCLMWGGTLTILTTRSYKGSMFDQLVEQAKKVIAGQLDPAKDYVLPWSYHFLPITVAVEQGLAEKINRLDHIDLAVRDKFLHECRARARSEDKFNREYMCIPSDDATTLIAYDMYYACQDSDCMNKMGDGPKYMGIDVARSHHKTVFWIWEKVGDVMVTRQVHKLRNTPYGAQFQFAADLIERHKIQRTCGDATGLGDMLIESLQDKFGVSRVEKVKFTSDTKDKLASKMLGFVQDKRVRLPDDMDCRESFHSIKKTVSAGNNVRYDTTQSNEEHADEFWAGCLGLDAGTQPTDIPMCYTSSGSNSVAA